MSLRAGSTVLRPWNVADAESLVAQANDRRVWLGLRDAFPHPYGTENAIRFISMAISKEPPTRFAIEVSGRLAGGIGYTERTDVERIGAEVGYWLGHEFWGRGATTALRLLTDHVFRVRPELWPGPVNRDCAQRCIADGAKVVLIDESARRLLKVTNPEATRGQESHHVRITGALDANAKALQVASVTVLEEYVPFCARVPPER